MVLEFNDIGANFVEESPVVRNDNEGVFVLEQVMFEPQDGFKVQMVGGFVQHEQVGFDKECGRQGHAHSPSSTQSRCGTPLHIGGELQTGQNHGRPSLGRIRCQQLQPRIHQIQLFQILLKPTVCTSTTSLALFALEFGTTLLNRIARSTTIIVLVFILFESSEEFLFFLKKCVAFDIGVEDGLEDRHVGATRGLDFLSDVEDAHVS